MRTSDDAEIRQSRFSAPPGAADILLVRHGESLPGPPDEPRTRSDGRADPPLDPRGFSEAERVADRLAGERLTAIYVTPLQRTAQTAAPLARKLAIEPRVEPDLVEVHLGEWEGPMFHLRMRERHPLAQRLFDEQRWDIIPGGEPMDALTARVRAAIGRITAAHADERVAVFTHGGIIATVAALATGSRPFAFVGAENASLTHLVVHGERWVLRRFNDTGHLDNDLDRPVAPLT
jgi:2,3-bisphosphoglycerate-dependent phosphoglycerate mutase